MQDALSSLWVPQTSGLLCKSGCWEWLIQPVPASLDPAEPQVSPASPRHPPSPALLSSRCWGWRMKWLFPPQSPPCPFLSGSHCRSWMWPRRLDQALTLSGSPRAPPYLAKEDMTVGERPLTLLL